MMNRNWICEIARAAEALAPGMPGKQVLEAHEAHCPECRAWRARAGRLAEVVGETLRRDAEAAGLSPAATRALVGQILDPSSAPFVPSPSKRRPVLRYALAATAVTGAVLGVRPAIDTVRRSREVEQARTLPGGSGSPVTRPKELAATSMPRSELPGAGNDFSVRAAPGSPSSGPHQRRDAHLSRTVRPARSAGVGRRPIDDLDYLNEPGTQWVQPSLGVRGTAPGQSNAPLPKDDFVTVPLPQVADATGRVAAAALAAYQKEAAVVDTRLFRKVTLQVRGGSLEELCEALSRETGVTLRAARGVRDEKATVLVKELPARDVMRALARLLGFRWTRSGEEAAFRYEISQDLRSQLQEEELRNRDLNGALLAVDAEMEKYRTLLSQSPSQLKARMATATGAERTRLQTLAEKGGWGGLQAYARLSPAERLALRNGETLQLRSDAENEEGRLPSEWQKPLLESWNIGVNLNTTNGREFWRGSTSLSDAPVNAMRVGLRLNRSEAGQCTLEGMLYVQIPAGMDMKGNGTSQVLALGQSPSVANPANAEANRALERQEPFTRTITLRPKGEWHTRADREEERTQPTGVTSAEVWAAIHQETGLPIIADFYSRVRPAGQFALGKTRLFDALCASGDRLGARWQKDGDVVLCRSTSYFWDKLKEVPNRFLKRWQQDARGPAGLPLDDVLEMATLSDVQLNSAYVAEVVAYGWGLGEYALVAGADRGPNPMRRWARFTAALAPAQRRQMAAPEGLSFAELLPPQQQELLQLAPWLNDPILARDGFDPALVRDTRMRLVYAPAGTYWWAPRDSDGALQVRDVMLVGRNVDAVLERARKIDPTAGPDQVLKSEGDLLIHGQIGNRLKFGQSRSHGFVNLVP